MSLLAQISLSTLADKLRLRGLAVTQIGDAEIVGVTSDSREVTAGNLFAALPGLTVDGNKFAQSALALGATAILTPSRSEVFTAQLIVEDVHLALGVVSSYIFNSQVQKQFSIGVTGTNGKTSISFLIAQAVSLMDGKAVYGGTLGLKTLVRGKELQEGIETNTTTPDMVEFHRYLGQQTDSRGFAVEISSMALDQKRLCGLELDTAIFSNLTRDHLDYHKTLENYFEAKKLLFSRDLAFSNKSNRVAILNIKHQNLREFADELRNSGATVWGYSVDSSSQVNYPLTKLLSYSLTLSGAEFEIEVENKKYSGASKLIGNYNLENLLAVITALLSLQYPVEEILKVLPGLSGVPGRVQRVAVERENIPTVLIDYAHTPDALENALKSVRELTKGRLITVFGCGGDRDHGKRPLMAEVASRLSDLTILTSDNPRSENPNTIIEAAEKGLVLGAQSLSIVDRKQAIFEAIKKASPNDAVVIAGKGHEPYQEIQGVRYRFLDEEIASSALVEFFK